MGVEALLAPSTICAGLAGSSHAYRIQPSPTHLPAPEALPVERPALVVSTAVTDGLFTRCDHDEVAQVLSGSCGAAGRSRPFSPDMLPDGGEATTFRCSSLMSAYPALGNL